ncbi:MAG TPA: transcriptional regulator, partial [Anaerolineae bacterium]|nr:transcriptional regulator [Anaerolineae bacterium]
AVRDEIVALVKRSLDIKPELAAPPAAEAQPEAEVVPAPQNGTSPEPKTGVEIISVEERKGKNYYSLRDLRNGNIVHNVTRQSARKLWQYALTEHESHVVDPTKIEWHGDIGLWKKYKRGGQIRFDLLQRGTGSNLHIYYGVTEDGIHGPWQKLIDTNDVV